MKIIKIVATRYQILRLKCTKFYFGWDSAYSAPPDSLAGFKGPTFKGKEERGGEKRGMEGRGGEEGKSASPFQIPGSIRHWSGCVACSVYDLMLSFIVSCTNGWRR